MSSPDIGTIYVLSNVDGSLSKVGMTRDGTPDSRADDYSAQHGIRWRCYWSSRTERVAEVEAQVHAALRYCRWADVPGAREIYYTPPHKTVAVAARYVLPHAGDAAQAQAAPAPRWAAYLEPLAAAAIPTVARLLTARLRRYRFGRQILTAQSMLLRLLNALRP